MKTLSFKINAPKVLPNGAEVIDFKIKCGGEITALCKRPGAEYHPYVTWRLDEVGNAFWGHYFKTLEEARDDFKER